MEAEKIQETINCNLCGTEIEAELHECPGCGTLMEILKRPVQLPIPRGSINDYPGLLTESETGELSSMVGAFFKQTDVPIVISIVQTTQPLTPAEYAFLMYNSWGIGKKGVNRGILILLCLREKHLESEVGLGLENILPEETGDEIVQTAFLPAFRDGKFFEGLRSGTKAIIEFLQERLPTLV